MRWLSDETVRHLKRVAEWPDLGETKYRPLDELGRGGMSTVYLAEDTVLGRKVALKVVATAAARPDIVERMRTEARVIAGLEHPGIVPVHDAGMLPDGRVYYAMKRVDGKRLDELAGTMALTERLRAFQRICEAVAFAHAHGVVHRDLKPENVMIGPFGEVLVMDWGVAKVLADADAASMTSTAPAGSPAATADGQIIGTLAYMAPEQAEGSAGRTGIAADIYALGATLHFLLTGRAPFDDATAARRANGEPRLAPAPVRRINPDAPRPLEAIVLRAMATDPAARYESAADLCAEVARFLDGERVHSYREGPLERAGRFFARYQAPILILLAYLVMRTVLFLYGRR
jgi:eukaryotic-like serine/threonine-protein kinase